MANLLLQSVRRNPSFNHAQRDSPLYTPPNPARRNNPKTAGWANVRMDSGQITSFVRGSCLTGRNEPRPAGLVRRGWLINPRHRHGFSRAVVCWDPNVNPASSVCPRSSMGAESAPTTATRTVHGPSPCIRTVHTRGCPTGTVIRGATVPCNTSGSVD